MITLLLFLLPACGNSRKSEEALNRYRQEENEILKEMQENMAVAATGNASAAFLDSMMAHHQAAISMAESYLKYGGNNAELKTTATELIDSRTPQIETMRELIMKIQASDVKDEETEQKYLEKYEKIQKNYEHKNNDNSASTNVEHAFARGMLHHQQMAVDISKIILEYTDHEEVRTLAQNMMEEQEEVIKKLKKIAG